MKDSVDADVAAINAIRAVPTILQAVTELTGLRFACVARVTEAAWTACAVLDNMNFGLKSGDELELTSTFCHVVRATGEAMVIDHVSADPFLRDHRTPKLYGFESYIALPLYRRDGAFFGTLCAIDPLPMVVSDPKTMRLMQCFVEIIRQELDGAAPPGTRAAGQHGLGPQQTAELRQQFAALGQNLLAPLATILGDAATLRQGGLDESAGVAVDGILDNGRRMAASISDALDFAQTRLGGALALRLSPVDDLGTYLRQVVGDMQALHPQRRIECELALPHSVYCDRARVAQLLAKLLDNAVRLGAPECPVKVSAASCSMCLVIKVSHYPAAGAAAAEEAGAATDSLAPLLLPASRAQPQPHGEPYGEPYGEPGSEPQPGLALDLYLAAEIARAHGGKLEASAGERATTLVFTMASLQADA